MKIVVMAGGSGERFWPLSTKKKPKQLLTLFSHKTMLKETIDRVLMHVDSSDIYIATNKIQYEKISKEIKNIPNKNIIIEPDFKDTSAAIIYSSAIINREFPNEIIVVLASDHLIKNNDTFINSLVKAEMIAKKGYIVTLGIKPDKPKTEYGYMELEKRILNVESKVISFKEKPDKITAMKYLEKGNYVWNSGMFIFKYSTLINELKKYTPEHFNILSKIEKIMIDYSGIELSNLIEKFYKKFKKISIDYAIMEKTSLLKCIPVDIGWNDVGNFLSLEEVFEKNYGTNVVREGLYYSIDSNNNIIISEKKNRVIATINVNDKIIVDSTEALMICNKNDVNKIKELLKKLK